VILYKNFEYTTVIIRTADSLKDCIH